MNKLLVLTLAALLFMPAVSHAHQLESDGSIGIVLHTDPDDAPAAGSPATFFFDITDLSHHFDPAQCTCTASIVQGTKTVFEHAIFSKPLVNDTASDYFSYTIPSPGEYEVVVHGVPRPSGNFQPFVIRYQLHVDAAAIAPVGFWAAVILFFGPHLLHVIFAIGAGLFVFGAAFYERFIKPKPKS